MITKKCKKKNQSTSFRVNKTLYHDVASDIGDLQGQRQHVQLAHHLQDQLSVRPRQLQQAKQVEGVTETQTQVYNIRKRIPRVVGVELK